MSGTSSLRYQLCHFHTFFASHLCMLWVNSEKKEFAPSRVDPFGAGSIVQRSKQEVIKVAFLWYMEEMCDDVHVPINLNKLFH